MTEVKRVVRRVVMDYCAPLHVPIEPSFVGSAQYSLYGMPNDVLEKITEETVDVFTQQHYEKLAATISEHLVSIEERGKTTAADPDETTAARNALTEFAHALIKIFEAENPKFKPFKFIEAAFGKANETRKEK